MKDSHPEGGSPSREAARLLAQAWARGGDAGDALAVARALPAPDRPDPDLSPVGDSIPETLQKRLDAALAAAVADRGGERVPFPPQPKRGERVLEDWEARRIIAPLSRPPTWEEWRASVALALRHPDPKAVTYYARRGWLGPRGERFDEYDPRWNHDPRVQRWRSDVANRAKKAAAAERNEAIRQAHRRGIGPVALARMFDVSRDTVWRALR